VEMIDSNAVYLLSYFGVQNDKCETVQQSVKVFEDSHRSSSF